jgi:tetratricopeptide (TPR) repeat protein
VAVGIGEAAADIPTLGAASVPMLLARIAKSRLHKRALERYERSARDIDIEQGIAAEVFADLIAVHRRKSDIPFVLVIEDAHDADGPLLELLRLVLDPEQETRLPMLVVALGWPHRIAEQEHAEGAGQPENTFGQLLADFRAIGVSVDRRSLGPLPDAGMREIILGAAPNSEDAVLLDFVRHCEGNPFMARLLLDLDIVKGSIKDGAITLDLATVARLPATVADAMRELWGQLPREVQLVLELASVQGREFVAALTAHLAETVTVRVRTEPTDPRAALELAVDPYEWVRRLDREVLIFFERYNHELALDAAGKNLHLDGIEAAIASYVTGLRNDVARWDALDDGAQRVLLEAHVRTAKETRHDANLRDAAGSAWMLAKKHSDQDLSAAAAWAGQATELLRQEERDLSRTAVDRLESLETTELLRAVQESEIYWGFSSRGWRTICQEQLHHAERLLAPSSRAYSETRKFVAQIFSLPPDEDNIRLLRDVLHGAQDADEAEESRELLASALRWADRDEEALRLWRIALEEARGADQIARAKRSLALELGSTEEAIGLWRELLEEARAPDEVNDAKKHLALKLEDTGRHEEAVALWRDLLDVARGADQGKMAADLADALERVRQWDHAIRLRRELLQGAREPDEANHARASLAWALERSGQWNHAIALRREVLEAARGLDEVKDAKDDLAEALKSAGRHDEAILLWRTWLEEARGADQIAWTKQSLALELGSTEEAIGLWRELLEEARGPDKAEAKQSLAYTLEDAGRHDEAIRLWRELAEEALGPDPVNLAKSSLADALDRAARLDQAIALRRELLDEAQLESLVRETKEELADALGRTGEHDEAIRLRHELVDGAESRTQEAAAELDLAAALEQAGQVEPALEHWRRALEVAGNQTQVSHVQYNLAAALERAARHAEAIPIRRELLSKAQGTDVVRRAKQQLADTLESSQHYDEAIRLGRELLRDAHGSGQRRRATRELVNALQSTAQYDEIVLIRHQQLDEAKGAKHVRRAKRALADALKRAGKHDEAMRMWRELGHEPPAHPTT